MDRNIKGKTVHTVWRGVAVNSERERDNVSYSVIKGTGANIAESIRERKSYYCMLHVTRNKGTLGG